MRSNFLGVTFFLTATLAFAAKPVAKSEIKDADGKTVGTATLTEGKGGVKVTLNASDLKPGKHGVHIHSVGKCEGPDFKSAGPHFNPDNKHHGHQNPEGSHAGDLGNMTVGQNGKGKLKATAKGATLGEGENSLFSATGTSLVIHADVDDEKTDPAGNAGARIACGAIEKSE